MTFRSRVALALGVGALLPLLVLALGVRREMSQRLTSQADARVARQIEQAGEQLQLESRTLGTRLDRLVSVLRANNEIRLAIVAGPTAVPSLRDWAREAMLQSDLTVLELVDSVGRVLSSGHFRNEFDRSHAGLAQTIERDSLGTAVFHARTPAGQVEALVVARSFDIAGRRLALVGGSGLSLERLVGSDAELEARLFLGDSSQSSGSPGTARLPIRVLRFEDTLIVSPAAITLTRDLGPLTAIRTSVDRWLLTAAAVVLLLTGLIVAWLSSRISRPLADLAAKTTRLDLDRLDQSFGTGRSDEIGALAGVLDEMTGRLRTSVTRLREAERRAVTGDLARQINHDVKNGLAPIRHVLRHFSQVARENPQDLATVYHERSGTLESSVEYLENLSRNYARLSPALDHGESDSAAVLQEIVGGMNGIVPVDLQLPESLPRIRADAVALRRIVENLVTNAIEAARDVFGRVTVVGESARRDGVTWVRLTVADTGRGMTQEELNEAFDDFFTTKSGGTGLGLTVVRRLVTDLGGVLRVETAPGQGSRFIVELPAGKSS
jgi:signal transduction histidine kinase